MGLSIRQNNKLQHRSGPALRLLWNEGAGRESETVGHAQVRADISHVSGSFLVIACLGDFVNV